MDGTAFQLYLMYSVYLVTCEICLVTSKVYLFFKDNLIEIDCMYICIHIYTYIYVHTKIKMNEYRK